MFIFGGVVYRWQFMPVCNQYATSTSVETLTTTVEALSAVLSCNSDGRRLDAFRAVPIPGGSVRDGPVPHAATYE